MGQFATTSVGSSSIKQASEKGLNSSRFSQICFVKPLLLFNDPGNLKILWISIVTLGSIFTPISFLASSSLFWNDEYPFDKIWETIFDLFDLEPKRWFASLPRQPFSLKSKKFDFSGLNFLNPKVSGIVPRNIR